MLLRERAAARGLAPATYVAVYTRAHLRSLAPPTKEEPLALKRSIAELGAIGRSMNQIARAANQGESVAGSRAERPLEHSESVPRAQGPCEGVVASEPTIVGGGHANFDK